MRGTPLFLTISHQSLLRKAGKADAASAAFLGRRAAGVNGGQTA